MLVLAVALLVSKASTAAGTIIAFPPRGHLFMDAKNVSVVLDVSKYYLAARHSAGRPDLVKFERRHARNTVTSDACCLQAHAACVLSACENSD